MKTDRPFLNTYFVTINFLINLLMGIILNSNCNYIVASLILSAWLLYKSNFNKTTLLNFCLWNFYILLNITLIFSKEYILYETVIENKTKLSEDLAITYTFLLIIHIMIIIVLITKG